MQKKHIITILIALGIVVVLYFGLTKPENPHGNLDKYRETEHAKVVLRNKDPEENCLDCHGEKGQTMENFCNKCHLERKIPTVEESLKNK